MTELLAFFNWNKFFQEIFLLYFYLNELKFYVVMIILEIFAQILVSTAIYIWPESVTVFNKKYMTKKHIKGFY